MSAHEILYFNGLGDGQQKPWESWLFGHLLKRDIHATHAHIDWRSGESFGALHGRMVALTREQLRRHGRLALVGSSAGCCEALNIFGELKDEYKDLFEVNLCGRLHPGEQFPWWDRRTLERKAHLGTDKASQSFYDAVTYCDETTIPSLTAPNKCRIASVKQLADFVVPRRLMDIEGVTPIVVPAVGHAMGIAMGAMRLPGILDGLTSRSR